MKEIIQFVYCIIVIIAAFSLWGCKSETETHLSDKDAVKVQREGEQADITITTKDGERVDLSVKKGELPDGWPSAISVIPGGDIVFAQSDEHNNVQQITIETNVPVAQALEFYTNAFTSNGWNIANTMSMPQMHVVTAEKKGREAMLQIVEDKDNTHVQIILNNKVP